MDDKTDDTSNDGFPPDTTFLIIEDMDSVPVVDIKTAVQLPDGRQGYLYPSGTIHKPNGAFLTWRQKGAVRPFDGDSARAAVKKRESLRSEAVQAAIISGTAAKDINEGVARLAAELVQVVLKGRQDRDKIQGFKELMKFAGLAYDLGRQSMSPGGQDTDISLSPGALSALNYLLPALEKRLKEAQDSQD
jgi:hypothetical protein